MRRAKSIYLARRRRDAASGLAGLFGEPAWDILLDIYIAQKSRREVLVSSVGIDAGVPLTTILRWLSRLELAGLINRTADTIDRRRRHVWMTPSGEALMTRMLESMKCFDPSA